MTSVYYDPTYLSLTVDGHAGYAEEGKDIVCAGVSALVYAGISALEKRGIKTSVSAEDGRISIQPHPSVSYRYVCHIIMETVMAGLEVIAEDYPGYVCIHIRENNEEE